MAAGGLTPLDLVWGITPISEGTWRPAELL